MQQFLDNTGSSHIVGAPRSAAWSWQVFSSPFKVNVVTSPYSQPLWKKIKLILIYHIYKGKWRVYEGYIVGWEVIFWKYSYIFVTNALFNLKIIVITLHHWTKHCAKKWINPVTPSPPWSMFRMIKDVVVFEKTHLGQPGLKLRPINVTNWKKRTPFWHKPSYLQSLWFKKMQFN